MRRVCWRPGCSEEELTKQVAVKFYSGSLSTSPRAKSPACAQLESNESKAKPQASKRYTLRRTVCILKDGRPHFHACTRLGTRLMPGVGKNPRSSRCHLREMMLWDVPLAPTSNVSGTHAVLRHAGLRRGLATCGAMQALQRPHLSRTCDAQLRLPASSPALPCFIRNCRFLTTT